MLRSRGQRSPSLACFGLPCSILTPRSMARKDVVLLGICQVPESISCLWQSMRRGEGPWATRAFRMCCLLSFRPSTTTLRPKREEGCLRLASPMAGCRFPLMLLHKQTKVASESTAGRVTFPEKPHRAEGRGLACG